MAAAPQRRPLRTVATPRGIAFALAGMVAAFALGLLPARPLHAAAPADGPVEISGAVFDPVRDHAGTPLQRVGAGLLRYRVVFKGYSAALYLPPGTDGAAWQDDVGKCLVLHYYWDIDKAMFGPAGREVLARTRSAEELAPLAPRLDAIDQAYADIAEGDRYALCYAPGTGTTLLKNEQPLVTIEGADFARTYYEIWLGADPVDAGLRDALTGGGGR